MAAQAVEFHGAFAQSVAAAGAAYTAAEEAAQALLGGGAAPAATVALVMGGNTAAGNAAPEYSVVRAFAMPSGMMPAIVQMGSAYGGPGGGNQLLNGLLKK